MQSVLRLWAALRAALLALILLGGSALPAASDIQIFKLDPCECADCLQLLRFSAEAERKAYGDRLPLALKAIEKELTRLSKPANLKAMLAEGNRPFCELMDIFSDEMNVVRTIDIPEIHQALFVGEARKCMPAVGITTDPATCKIDQEAAYHNEVSKPCDEVHLAFLAHELVHAEDCKRNPDKPVWKEGLDNKAACNAKFKGKKTPTIPQFMNFLKRAFETEVHAHDVESKVEALLENQLNKVCDPEDYSETMEQNPDYQEAKKFLDRAKKYKIKYP